MISGTWTDAVIDYSEDDDLTDEVDLGREYESLQVYVPTLESSTQVSFKVSEKSGGTFADLYVTDVADGGNNKVISAASSGGYYWTIPIGGFEFIKVATSKAQTADRTFRVCGTRS